MTRHLVLAVILSVVATSSSVAAQVVPTRQLSDSARRARNDSTPRRIAPVIVTGTLAPASRERLGLAVSVISSDDMTAEPFYASDALRKLPGAFIDEAAGPGGPTIVRVRGGEETFTNILIDGVKSNQNGGFFDFQGVTLTNVDRIEMVRGPQSALYGSSGVSGAVQLVPRMGVAGKPFASASFEGGGAQGPGASYRGNAEVAGGTERLRVSGGVGSAFSRGIYSLPHDLRSNDASVRLDAGAVGRTTVTGMFRYIGIDSRLPVRDAGATRVPLDPNAANARERVIASVRTDIAQSSSWRHGLRAALYRERFAYRDRNDNIDTSPYDFFIFDATFNFHSLLSRLSADYIASHLLRSATGGNELTVSYGAQVEDETLRERLSGDFGPGGQKLSRRSGALLTEAQARIGRADLLAGARLERYEGLSSEFVPRAAAVVALIPDRLSIRTVVGRAFKAPNLQEQYVNNPFIIGNPDLAPETSVSWELGAEVKSESGASTLGLTWFQQRFDNLIRTVPAAGTTGASTNRNVGRSTARGLELEGRHTSVGGWSVGADASWTMTEVKENSGLDPSLYPIGKALPFRPRYLAGAHVRVPAGRSLSSVVRASVVGPQDVLTERFSGDRVELSGYELGELDVTYDLAPARSIYARMTNIFDDTYVTAFDRRGGRRSLSVGVRLGR